ncbi:hypothetical protein ACWCQN_32480 [Streptomyces sp. NPDC001984]
MASNRRIFLTVTAAGALTAAPLTPVAAAAPGFPPRPPRSARAALAELLAGNRRYATGRPRHPHESRRLRRQLAAVQHPFAVIVGCIDSRVPPELILGHERCGAGRRTPGRRGRGIEVRISGVEHGHRRVLESCGVLSAAAPSPDRGAIPSAAGSPAP